MIKKLASILLLSSSIVMVATVNIIEDAIADRDDHQKKGSNGQCRKLQSSLPEEIRDYEGCHNSFTGKDHSDDEPLP